MSRKKGCLRLGKKISYGFNIIIILMTALGILNLVSLGISGVKFVNYAKNIKEAHCAVKDCRADINMAAGEAGNGFAVVAEQVSALAEQSAKAVKESVSLIESSKEAVKKGVMMADETAKHLEGVVTGSRGVMAGVNKIAMDMEQQASFVAKINRGIQQINEVAQTNSTTSQMCANESQKIKEQANLLKESVQRFSVV